MYFFALDEKSAINLASVASYNFKNDDKGEVVVLKMYDRTEKVLVGEQVDRFRRAVPHFTLGLVNADT